MKSPTPTPEIPENHAARVMPVDRATLALRGMLAGKIEFVGDIVHVDWTEEWETTR